MRDNGRLKIGELAKQAGVSAQAVRFYEGEGLLRAPARTAHGYRIYDLPALGRLNFIRHARDLGLSLAEIKEVLRMADSRRAPCCRVRELLGEKLKDLNERIDELTRFRDQLRRFLRELAALPDQADTSQQVCALIDMAPSLLSPPAPLDERDKPSRGRRPKRRSPPIRKTRWQPIPSAKVSPSGEGEHG